jgi:hypothetical protein
MLSRILALGLAALFVLGLAIFHPLTAFAGPIADYEAMFRDAYADYRNALFATNTKSTEASNKSITAFGAKWAALVARYREWPPPQYAEDKKWSESLDVVTAIVTRANAEVGRSAYGEAHETLESARDAFAALRQRNGVIAYSDRIDAFHHAMEQVLTKSYGGFASAGLTELVEDTAVLSYLGAELRKGLPPDAAQAPEFAQLLDSVIEAVADLRAAARAGDVEKIKASRTKIRSAFAKLVVKFG